MGAERCPAACNHRRLSSTLDARRERSGVPESLRYLKANAVSMSITRFLCIAAVFASGTAAGQSLDSEAQVHARQSYELARRNALAEAVTEMREAIRLSPGNPLYHSALAGILSKEDQLAGAKTELEVALSLKPPDRARTVIEQRLAETDLKLGEALARGGQLQEGLAVASDAAKRFEQDPKVWQMLGYFQQHLQLNSLAVQSYRNAVKLDPASAESNVGLATAQFAAGMEADAVRTLEAGIGKFPEDPAHFQALGVVLLRLSESGQDTAARSREMFEKALRLDQTLPEAQYEVGMSLFRANNLSAAKEHLLLAEASAPNDSRIHFALSKLYRREGQTADSEREMRAFERSKTEGNDRAVARLRREP